MRVKQIRAFKESFHGHIVNENYKVIIIVHVLSVYVMLYYHHERGACTKGIMFPKCFAARRKMECPFAAGRRESQLRCSWE